MNIADLARTHGPETRRVGVTFQWRGQVVAQAIHIYRDLGIACDLDELGISIRVPRVAAGFCLGALERATGTPGWSEWDAR
jgi:hypothetical protein